MFLNNKTKITDFRYIFGLQNIFKLTTLVVQFKFYICKFQYVNTKIFEIVININYKLLAYLNISKGKKMKLY